MKIFLTGSEGVIAKDLEGIGLWDAHQIIPFDKRLNPGMDITSPNSIGDYMPKNVDLIFHLANIPHPDANITASEYFRNNVQGCQNLLAVAKEKKVRGIVFFSSLAAVGFDATWFYAHAHSGKNLPITVYADDEDKAVLLPEKEGRDIEPYGWSKVLQEKLIRESGIPYLILRLGPYRDKVIPGTRAAVAKILADGIGDECVIHIPLTDNWGGKKLQAFLSAKKGAKQIGRGRQRKKS